MDIKPYELTTEDFEAVNNLFTKEAAAAIYWVRIAAHLWHRRQLPDSWTKFHRDNVKATEELTAFALDFAGQCVRGAYKLKHNARINPLNNL